MLANIFVDLKRKIAVNFSDITSDIEDFSKMYS